MRRTLLPATSILAVLTAGALLAAALSVRPTQGIPGLPAETAGRAEAANREVARRFYEAVNAALATGDLAPLEGITTPTLLAVADAAASATARIGLARRVLALRATAPSLRLRVEALAAEGDLVLVHASVAGTTEPAFLGLRLVAGPVPWGPVDVLRVADGRVVAFDGAESGVLEPILTVPLDASPDADRVALRRYTLAPGAVHVAIAADRSRLVVLQAGTIEAEVTPLAGSGASFDRALAAGDHLAIDRGSGYRVVNAGSAPAVLLEILADTTTPALQVPSLTAAPAEAGVLEEGLAGGMSAVPPTGAAVLAIGRATLAAGEGLAWSEPAGHVLLHVESGVVRHDAGLGVAWVRDPASGQPVTLGDQPLTAGTGALVVAGSAADLRAEADAPATILLVTLFPVEGTDAVASPTG